MENTLSTMISKARKDKNYTLAKLSLKTNTSISYLCDIEHGRKTPSLATLSKIINVLDISPNEVFKKINVRQ